MYVVSRTSLQSVSDNFKCRVSAVSLLLLSCLDVYLPHCFVICWAFYENLLSGILQEVDDGCSSPSAYCRGQPFVEGREIQGVAAGSLPLVATCLLPFCLHPAGLCGSSCPFWVGITTEAEKALLPSQSSHFLSISCLIISCWVFF